MTHLILIALAAATLIEIIEGPGKPGVFKF